MGWNETRENPEAEKDGEEKNSWNEPVIHACLEGLLVLYWPTEASTKCIVQSEENKHISASFHFAQTPWWEKTHSCLFPTAPVNNAAAVKDVSFIQEKGSSVVCLCTNMCVSIFTQLHARWLLVCSVCDSDQFQWWNTKELSHSTVSGSALCDLCENVFSLLLNLIEMTWCVNAG